MCFFAINYSLTKERFKAYKTSGYYSVTQLASHLQQFKMFFKKIMVIDLTGLTLKLLIEETYEIKTFPKFFFKIPELFKMSYRCDVFAKG